MWLQLILICIFTSFWSSFAFSLTDKIVCYHGSWSTYRNGKGKFEVEDINPNLCTHIIYAFVGINGNGSIRIMDVWNDIDRGGFQRFNGLKKKNEKLKTLLAIGGWNEGSEVFSRVANSAEFRRNLITDAVHFLQTYGFDGFDLDWEYPAQRGGGSYDKANFITLLQEFRTEFDKHRFLLTAAVAAAEASVNESYDVPGANRYLDFINVMTYDLHGSWDRVTGHNSPLYASAIDVTQAQKTLNVDACINNWISKGADKAKLILGMPTYGRTFTLANQNNNELGASTIGGGLPGPHTQETGFFGYYEICEKLEEGGWTRERIKEQKVPYAYKGNQWVGYDDVESINLKAQYAKDRGLGGAMIWSIETDDFRGICGPCYPLLNAIRQGLGMSHVDTCEGPGSETPTSERPSSEEPCPGGSYLCKSEGYERNPCDCAIFYYCQLVGNSFIKHKFRCPAGLVFDTRTNVCNWPSEVAC